MKFKCCPMCGKETCNDCLAFPLDLVNEKIEKEVKGKEKEMLDKFEKMIDEWANDCDVHSHSENSICQVIDVSKLKQKLKGVSNDN